LNAKVYKENTQATIMSGAQVPLVGSALASTGDERMMLEEAAKGREEEDGEEGEKKERELTLEERLQAMAVASGLSSTPMTVKRGGNSTPRVRKNASSSLSSSSVPTATSLYTMLTQAVNSTDTDLLETVLAVSDKKVVSATVRRLNPGVVASFLEKVLVRLTERPNRGAGLVEWVRAVVVCHAAYLMSVSNSVHPSLSLSLFFFCFGWFPFFWLAFRSFSSSNTFSHNLLFAPFSLCSC
jgi:hypothetical protein